MPINKSVIDGTIAVKNSVHESVMNESDGKFGVLTQSDIELKSMESTPKDKPPNNIIQLLLLLNSTLCLDILLTLNSCLLSIFKAFFPNSNVNPIVKIIKKINIIIKPYNSLV